MDDVLDAAVHSLINARCRQAYLHDLRGGLQAVFSSVELLSRAAKRGDADAARLDHITGLAKRAMVNQEQSLLNIVNQITFTPEAASAFDLAQLLREVQQFLRNDAAQKGVGLEIDARLELTVSAPRTPLRSLLAGLIALSIDALPADALLQIDLTQLGNAAVLELRCGRTFRAIRSSMDLLRVVDEQLQPQDLVLSALRRWVLTHRGRIEVGSAAGTSVLRVCLPLASA